MGFSEKTHCIGLMSGTSLDGLDICHVTFDTNNLRSYKITHTSTIAYPADIAEKLAISTELSGLELSLLDIELGKHIGKTVKQFISEHNIQTLDFIASHGHTVFHQPEKGLSLQIGSGHHIATISGIKTICDFRMHDVALEGQGAPLVPIGDMLLFSEYDQCLNIGGIANISFTSNGKRTAYDICFANMVFNQLAQRKGLEYDKDGNIAKGGKINKELLNKLNSLPFYTQPAPKSLGKEWVDTNILPLIRNKNISTEDLLRTTVEHVSTQIAESSNTHKGKRLLITGGGAHNSFLIGELKKKTNAEICIPAKETIDFKEALIFALLGLLRTTGQNNCLSAVTGAKHDNCGGIEYMP